MEAGLLSQRSRSSAVVQKRVDRQGQLKDEEEARSVVKHGMHPVDGEWQKPFQSREKRTVWGNDIVCDESGDYHVLRPCGPIVSVSITVPTPPSSERVSDSGSEDEWYSTEEFDTRSVERASQPDVSKSASFSPDSSCATPADIKSAVLAWMSQAASADNANRPVSFSSYICYPDDGLAASAHGGVSQKRSSEFAKCTEEQA